MASADRSALYTEIDHDDGFRERGIKLEERPDIAKEAMPTTYNIHTYIHITYTGTERTNQKIWHLYETISQIGAKSEASS